MPLKKETIIINNEQEIEAQTPEIREWLILRLIFH